MVHAFYRYMRIWSIHPKYLDSKGLIALWRETLLAKHVLSGLTKGYKNHPQLHRFKMQTAPLDCINQYLSGVYSESKNRGYNFNADKVDLNYSKSVITVTSGQLEFEKKHLLKKLKVRNYELFQQYSALEYWELHPMFKLIDGNVESWEILNGK